MKIYVIDNYDSFVYNIVHLLKELTNTEVKIVKNDAVDFEELKHYNKILLSPGPGVPSDAGDLMSVIDTFHASHSILGVCLGHQALGSYFGWELHQLQKPLHGVAGNLKILIEKGLFANVPDKNKIGHYHSWVVKPPNNETELQTLATDELGNIMAFKHKRYPLFGVQFHPESILTENGKTIINNWLHYTK